MRHQLFAALLVTACSPEAVVADGQGQTQVADASGRYLITIVAETDQCNVFSSATGGAGGASGGQGGASAGGTGGTAAADVAVLITQQGDQVTVTVESIAGALLGLLHGSNVYQGTVTGNRIVGTIFGVIPGVQGTCSYTWNNQLEAQIDGDVLSGTVTYVPATNGSPDCPDCVSRQRFNGVRAPAVSD